MLIIVCWCLCHAHAYRASECCDKIKMRQKSNRLKKRHQLGDFDSATNNNIASYNLGMMKSVGGINLESHCVDQPQLAIGDDKMASNFRFLHSLAQHEFLHKMYIGIKDLGTEDVSCMMQCHSYLLMVIIASSKFDLVYVWFAPVVYQGKGASITIFLQL